MSPENPLRLPPSEKLRFLAKTVVAATALLAIAGGCLFALPAFQRSSAPKGPLRCARTATWWNASMHSSRDSVACRTTVGDKLLPGILARLAEPNCPFLEKMARAELPGWISFGADSAANSP